MFCPSMVTSRRSHMGWSNKHGTHLRVVEMLFWIRYHIYFLTNPPKFSISRLFQALNKPVQNPCLFPIPQPVWTLQLCYAGSMTFSMNEPWSDWPFMEKQETSIPDTAPLGGELIGLISRVHQRPSHLANQHTLTHTHTVGSGYWLHLTHCALDLLQQNKAHMNNAHLLWNFNESTTWNICTFKNLVRLVSKEKFLT